MSITIRPPSPGEGCFICGGPMGCCRFIALIDGAGLTLMLPEDY